jgi:hypothetical protein
MTNVTGDCGFLSVLVYINNKITTCNNTNLCRICLYECVDPQGRQVLVVKYSKLILI